MLHQVPERTKVEVQVLAFQAENLLELVHFSIELHECLTQALNLVVCERACLDPPNSLTLEQPPNELDERENELGQTLLDALWVRLDPVREARFRSRAELTQLLCKVLQIGEVAGESGINA